MRKRKTEIYGFTLLELIIVLLILSVIIGIVIPQIKGSIKTLQIDRISYQIAGMIKRGVIGSKSSGLRYYIEFNKTTESIYLKKESDDKLDLLDSAKIPEGIYILSKTNPLVFYPNKKMQVSTVYVFYSDNQFDIDVGKALNKEFVLGQIQSITEKKNIYTISVDEYTGSVDIEKI